MVPCKLEGYIDPKSGQCNCDPTFLQIQDEKRPKTRKHRRAGNLSRKSRRLTRSRRQHHVQSQNSRKKSKPTNDISTPDTFQLTDQCRITNDGKVDCDFKSKAEWRSNINQAELMQKDLELQLQRVTKLQKRLKNWRNFNEQSKSPGKARIELTPCQCNHPDSFKIMAEMTYRSKLEEYQKEKQIRIVFS